MKLAIVGFGFSGSTLPLVKTLLDKGHDVDFYFCVYNTQKKDSFEAFELDSVPFLPLLKKVNLKKCRGVDYLIDRANFNLYKAVHIGVGHNKPKFVSCILTFVATITALLFSFIIFMKKYDFVHVIGQEKLSLWYHVFFKNTSHGIHEVLSSHTELDKEACSTVNLLVKRKIPIVVHSKKSYNDFRCLFQDYVDIYIIPFGKFETYLFFNKGGIENIRESNDYILFYGFITPYKGLPFLYEIIEKLKKTFDENVKVVVAGKGNDKALEIMKNNKNYVVINRWISNDELVALISNSKIVVCPYISASQSGIPQTVFMFGKPLVTTDVGAFGEIVRNGINGFVVDNWDLNQFVDDVIKLYSDHDLYESMQQNISKWEEQAIEYDWEKIGEQYLQLIAKIRKQNN